MRQIQPPGNESRFVDPKERETPEGKATRLHMQIKTPGAAKAEEWIFHGRANEEPDEILARIRTAPAYNAAEVIHAFNGTPNETLRGLVNEVDRQAKAVKRGDLSQMEAMLAAQAHTLDAVFTRLAKLAHSNMGKNFAAAETLLRLAFKAQSQCRATVESLGQLKNPAPVAFVKQANIAAGHQQVNNGVEPCARENVIEPNKLLEVNHGERLDIGAARPASGVDKDVEAVAAINRPQDSRRKGKGEPQR